MNQFLDGSDKSDFVDSENILFDGNPTELFFAASVRDAIFPDNTILNLKFFLGSEKK